MELIFRDDAYRKSCEATVTAADEAGIRLDRTVFYPTGGGQPGDTGILRLEDGRTLRIVEARKGADHEDVVHVPDAGRRPAGSGEIRPRAGRPSVRSRR